MQKMLAFHSENYALRACLLLKLCIESGHMFSIDWLYFAHHENEIEVFCIFFSYFLPVSNLPVLFGGLNLPFPIWIYVRSDHVIYDGRVRWRI